MFDPQHLKGASAELVQSMFKIDRKVTELEHQKLQVEICNRLGLWTCLALYGGPR